MEVNATSGGAKDHLLNYQQMSENKNEEAALQHGNEEEAEGKKGTDKKSRGDMGKGMKKFIWNPETRQFMGRTARSWGLILLFYLALYLFLAGMFAFCMYMMLMTLSPYTPKHRDRVAPPGVMIRPHVRSSVNINFKPADQTTWQEYVDNLRAFLEAYDDKVQEQKNIQCSQGRYFIQDGDESGLRKACQFKRSVLNDCSGISDPSFGYSKGQPCILLKMNKIVGYKPGYGNPVTVSCSVLKGDASDITTVKFYPSSTFDPMYFPYYGKLTHVNYTQPLVGIQFLNVAKNKEINVQCQLNGKGIINNFNSDRFLGRVVFMLKLTV